MHRRIFAGIGAASLLTVGVLGGVAVWLPSGLEQGKLSSDGRTLFLAVVSAVLRGMTPVQQGSQGKLADRIDQLLAALPPATQIELAQLVGILSTSPGRRVIAGLDKDWGKASADEVKAALEGMASSTLQARVQAFHALRDIVAAAHFADPSSWPAIGYAGPLEI